MKNDIEKMLENSAPKLRQEEVEVLWRNIEAKITTKVIPSPFFNIFTLGRMSVAALALILIIGVGSTTAAAQQSRPGDVLFPIERALEEVRLALASNDTARASLQLEFAEERLAELRSLIEETSKVTISEVAKEASSTKRFSGEADVFTDVTIVSVEINDVKTNFRTDAQTRDEVVEDISRRYNIDKSIVDAGLDFEIENRASRVSDITHSNNNDERIDESMKLLSSLVDDIDDNERKRFVNEVLDTLDFDSQARVEIRDDEDDKRIEIRDGDERVRIREKDGEVRIEIKSDDDSDDRSDDNRYDEAEESDDDEARDDESNDDDDSNDEDRDDSKDDDSDENSRDDYEESEENENRDDEDDDSNDDEENEEEVSKNVESIEVRVEDDEAEIEISYGNDEDEFTLPYVSRTALVAAIATKTGLSESVVEDNLELEIKD